MTKSIPWDNKDELMFLLRCSLGNAKGKIPTTAKFSQVPCSWPLYLLIFFHYSQEPQCNSLNYYHPLSDLWRNSGAQGINGKEKTILQYTITMKTPPPPKKREREKERINVQQMYMPLWKSCRLRSWGARFWSWLCH